LCNGEVIPQSPGVKTLIELTHRITSGLALIVVLVLCWWAYRAFARGDRVRRFAVLSAVFILIEALLGAGLVLLEYVDQNKSVGRAFYLSAHLINTQILLGTLALTAWYSQRRRAAALDRGLLGGALVVMLIVGVSGAIAALGDTLFPATSLSEGIRQEMSETAHFLLRLRILHPALALFSAIYVAIAGLKVIKERLSPAAVTIAWWTWGLVFLQLLVGMINVALLAPVWLQIVHLLIADLLWIALVLLAVEGSSRRELSRSAGI
jgi:cytochrome c oxidase assembly protein subunit 15